MSAYDPDRANVLRLHMDAFNLARNIYNSTQTCARVSVVSSTRAIGTRDPCYGRGQVIFANMNKSLRHAQVVRDIQFGRYIPVCRDLICPINKIFRRGLVRSTFQVYGTGVEMHPILRARPLGLFREHLAATSIAAQLYSQGSLFFKVEPLSLRHSSMESLKHSKILPQDIAIVHDLSEEIATQL